jgi:hypothetical protein
MNCPLCRAPIKTTCASGRYVTCFNGHETNIKSVLPGVLPTIPGWICWQTRSNGGIPEMRYAYVGEYQTAEWSKNEEDTAQELINRYEEWMEHSYHGARIEWELDCAVPHAILLKTLKNAEAAVLYAQRKAVILAEQLKEYYPNEA